MCIEVIFIKHNWQCWIPVFPPNRGHSTITASEHGISYLGKWRDLPHHLGVQQNLVTFRELGGAESITGWKNTD